MCINLKVRIITLGRPHLIPNTGFAHQGYAAPVMAPPEYLKVTFSLVSVQEFTARVDTGAVSLEILDLIRRIPGAKFDWEKKRWMFPLAAHDNLQVLCALHCCQSIADYCTGCLIAQEVHD